MSAVIHGVSLLLQRQSESHYSTMTSEFSNTFSPKVTIPPLKPKSKIGFRSATFLVKDAPGIPVIWWIKNDIILVGFRVDNYCLLRTRSSEQWERKWSELKPSSLVGSSLMHTSATNRPDFKCDFFFNTEHFQQKFPEQWHSFLTKQPQFPCSVSFGGSTSVSLIDHSGFCSSKASATLAQMPSEPDWGTDLAEN